MFDYFSINLKIPYKLKRRKKSFSHLGYKVTYRKSDGSYCTQFRYVLPRIVDFPDYYSLSLNDYIGCSNGFGWIITNIELL